MSNSKQFPFKTVIFYNGKNEDEASKVVVEETIVAPSVDVAKILAVLALPDDIKESPAKIARLEFSVSFLT